MSWNNCLVRFMSLFLVGCFDAACLLFFWHLSRIFWSALSDVCILCVVLAITACVLVSLQFCLMRGWSWGVCVRVCCVAGAYLGPCVCGNRVPWCVGTAACSCPIALSLSCSDCLGLPLSYWAELFNCLSNGRVVLNASLYWPAVWGLNGQALS